MDQLLTTANKLMTGVSLLTAMGIFVHDGRVDKAASIALHPEHAAVTASEVPFALKFKQFLQADGHTHPDHNATKSSLMNSFAYQNPSIPPRGQEQKRHMLQKYQLRGHHPFDNYNLPVVS